MEGRGSSPRHAVVVVGGAVAGSEAAALLSEAGVLTVVLEQRDRPYGKIEDGLPRWHVRQREKEFAQIDAKLTQPLVHFVPRTRLGFDVTLPQLLTDWHARAVLLATGAWRDRPLPIPGLDDLTGRGLAYQNPFVYWFNHAPEPSYDGPRFEVEDGTIVVGGGLASIDVIKIVQLELVGRALARRGIDAPMLDLEHDGIPSVLARHRLRWEDLGLKGGALYYRRRIEDMPLAWPAPGSGPDGLSRIHQVRRKIIRKAQDKYCFRFFDQRVPTGAIVEDGHLRGLRMARTLVPKGREGRPQVVPGSEEEVRAPLVISSIGSTPEVIPGIPREGEYYRYKSWDTGELEGYDGVYALGNVVTGQGNIRASRIHATQVTSHVVETYLGVADDPRPQELDVIVERPSRNARLRAEQVLARLDGQVPLQRSAVDDVLARVAALRARVGYTDYRSWIEASYQTPPSARPLPDAVAGR